MFVLVVACDPSSMLVPFSTPNFLFDITTLDSNDDREDDIPHLPIHFPLFVLAQPLPLWVYSTCEMTCDLVDDLRD